MNSNYIFWAVIIILLSIEDCIAQKQSDFSNTTELKSDTIYVGSYIRRPTLVVSNMDRALTIYRDILGFQLGSLSVDPPDSYIYTVCNIPQGTEVKHATLDTDKEKRTLSLVEVQAMKPINKDDLRTSMILVNANGRLDEIIKRLSSENYKLLPMHTLGKTGREIGFIDSDGHLIVLYEFPKR